VDRDTAIGQMTRSGTGADAAGGRGRLWLDWVKANAVGEWLGLGGAALIGWLALRWLESVFDVAMAVVLSSFVFGLVEGSILGWFQHRVLVRPLPFLTRGGWIAATVVGGTIAWLVASTIVTIGGAGAAGVVEPSPTMQVALAAALGLAAGPVLGVPQALVFRTWLGGRAWHWVWANALAWAVAMPVVFIGAGLPGEGAGFLPLAAAVSVTLLAAGAIAGAIHGAVMVWLLGARLEQSAYPHVVLDELSNLDTQWQELGEDE
jgi:hypothetical protein